jgi:hypothetical protein
MRNGGRAEALLGPTSPVAKFGLAFVTVPISNASVERAFSIYNFVKNKLRNRLSIEILQSMMMVRLTLNRNVKFIQCQHV